MGRTKTVGGSGGPGGSKHMNPGSQSPAPSEASNSSSAATMAESRIKDILKEVYFLIHQVQVSLLSNSPGTDESYC